MPPSYNPTTIDDSRWQHGNVFVDEAKEVRIHYIDCPPAPAASLPSSGESQLASKDPKVILLLHGFPQTAYQFRHVITPLADAGYRVIVPDERGAGESSHPGGGFDKVTVANDIYKLIHDHLGITTPIHVLGQDIGGMIAHAYAFAHPEHSRSVLWGECPLPGGDPYESGFKTSPGMWHFTFHSQPDLPEALIDSPAKIKLYLKHFYDRLCVNPSGITSRDVEQYVYYFSQPGGMRCGLGLYRAFPVDAIDNLRMLKESGKSKVPCAALDGEGSLLLEVAKEQTEQFYETWEQILITGSGHWTAEENPEDFVRKVVQFISKYD